MKYDFPTPMTLLAELQKPNPPDIKWKEFNDLYTPLLLRWAQQRGFQDADACDVAQEVLIKLTQELPTYVRGPGQSFRSWLYKICERQILNDFRTRVRRREVGPGTLAVAEVRQPDILEEENEYRKAVVHRACEMIQPEFEERTWRAFEMSKRERKSAKEVMLALGYQRDNAVFVASNRVLRRLREVIHGFVD